MLTQSTELLLNCLLQMYDALECYAFILNTMFVCDIIMLMLLLSYVYFKRVPKILVAAVKLNKRVEV